MGAWGAPHGKAGRCSSPLLRTGGAQLQHCYQCEAPQFRAEWELLEEPRKGAEMGGTEHLLMGTG